MTINQAPRTSPSQLAFHEKTEMVLFSFGEHGVTAGQSIAYLRTKAWDPFLIEGFSPVTLRMKGDTLLLHFKVWGTMVEVNDNEFTVRAPGFDKNSNAQALEVVDKNGAPVFQLIRKSSTEVIVNGYFPMPTGGLILAGPDGMEMMKVPSQSELAKFHLKPIFKYPAWKYTGQYAD